MNGNLNRGRDHFDAFALDRVIEAAAPPDMAGATDLIDEQQDGRTIHPGQHQYLAGVELLGDGGDQTLLIEGQVGQHFGKRQARADGGAFKSG